MKIRKVDFKCVIVHEGSNVTLKICEDSREVQFTAGNTTQYSYNAEDSQIKVTDALENVQKWEYDRS